MHPLSALTTGQALPSNTSLESSTDFFLGTQNRLGEFTSSFMPKLEFALTTLSLMLTNELKRTVLLDSILLSTISKYRLNLNKIKVK